MAQPTSIALPKPIPARAPSPAACTRYVARQPIVDRKQKVCGYELLFRNSDVNFFPGTDADAATCQVIDFALIFGWTELTGGSPAFINCTRNVLLSEAITLLPREYVIVEVLEDVAGDDQMVATCERLHRAGYTIALDDFVGSGKSRRLLHYADIVKVDFLATTQEEQVALAAEMRGCGIRLVAEKVETREQLRFAQRLGYDYFQGYYFSRPEPLTISDSTPCCGDAYIEALRLADSDFYDVEKLEQAILCEPSLCFRLLRYLEMANFRLSQIGSLRQALSLLGQPMLRQVVRKLMQVALCCEHAKWQEIPAGEKKLRPRAGTSPSNAARKRTA